MATYTFVILKKKSRPKIKRYYSPQHKSVVNCKTAPIFSLAACVFPTPTPNTLASCCASNEGQFSFVCTSNHCC